MAGRIKSNTTLITGAQQGARQVHELRPINKILRLCVSALNTCSIYRAIEHHVNRRAARVRTSCSLLTRLCCCYPKTVRLLMNMRVTRWTSSNTLMQCTGTHNQVYNTVTTHFDSQSNCHLCVPTHRPSLCANIAAVVPKFPQLHRSAVHGIFTRVSG